MTCQLDVPNAVDDLRQLIAKADALAYATEDLFDQVLWSDDDDDPRRPERLAHLIGATASAVQAALEASDKLAVDLAAHQPGADTRARR
ncbi:MAG: hypothetical protein ABIY55_01645 [Kofleriaceae bacterium]